jgi:hypothetical protein
MSRDFAGNGIPDAGTFRKSKITLEAFDKDVGFGRAGVITRSKIQIESGHPSLTVPRPFAGIALPRPNMMLQVEVRNSID